MENLSDSQMKRQAEPIAYKTTIALLNLVIVRTTDFMNKFYSETDSKLIKIEQRIERVETLLDLLDKKLESIPNILTNTSQFVQSQPIPSQQQQQPVQQYQQVQQVQVQPQQQYVQQQQVQQTNYQPQQQQQMQQQQQQQPTVDPEEERKKQELDAEREKFAGYIKLFKLGVPLQALYPKMQAEGLDPKGIEKFVDVNFRPG